MNAEFEQWAFSHKMLTGGFDAEPEAVYKHLRTLPNIQTTEAMKYWEYEYDDLEKTYSITAHRELFNERSKGGWEMVNAVILAEGGRVRFYWKRERHKL